ncbi:MAG: acyltransferase [Actinomycetota bacterium]|nr:acyltransferase [Actinomycetota bacterium]
MTKKMPADAIAALTPSTRDRYVDFLRAASILVVVLGHWLMAVVYFRDGALSGSSALDVVPGLWAATWVLQVMPLFFFVGGFSNFVSWRSVTAKGGTYSSFLRSRTGRLLKPTAVFVGAWIVVAAAVELAAPGSSAALRQATAILAKPLWFLAVYVLVVAVAPAMYRVHRRYSWRVPLALTAAAVVVDTIRIAGGMELVGYLNFAFVWLCAHQLGYLYADGSLVALGRRIHAVLALGGLAVLAALAASEIYSPSMVGMATDKASNNSPPTVCLIALTVWLVGLAMLLRPAISRWLGGARNWAAIVSVNSVIMTVYLWHLTALLVAVVVLYPLGFPQPAGGSAGWWLSRIPWIACLTVLLAGFVAVFGRFERSGFARSDARSRPWAAAAGTACVVAALAGFATSGFAGVTQLGGGGPAANALMFLCGYRLTAGRVTARVSRSTAR